MQKNKNSADNKEKKPDTVQSFFILIQSYLDNRTQRDGVLRSMRGSETAKSTPLQVVREVHTQNGSSLSVGGKLYWNSESQVLYPFPLICHCILYLIEVGLSMTWVTLCIDAYRDWKYVSSFYDQDTAIFVMVATTIASILLSLSIGALLIGQALGLSKNLTTLETFIPHIE